MPLVHISLKRERPPEERRAIADAVHAALTQSIGVPADDRFQVVSSRFDDLIYDPGYLGVARSAEAHALPVRQPDARGQRAGHAHTRGVIAAAAVPRYVRVPHARAVRRCPQPLR